MDPPSVRIVESGRGADIGSSVTVGDDGTVQNYAHLGRVGKAGVPLQRADEENVWVCVAAGARYIQNEENLAEESQ